MRKPFFKKSHSAWYCQLKCGKQVRLGTDKDEAFREYHRLMAGELPVTNRTTVAQLVDQFLVVVREKKSASSLKLTPDQLTFNAFPMDDVEFVDTAEELMDEWLIGKQVKAKLQSVVGNPKYIEANTTGTAEWRWTIGQLEVTYTHFLRQDELHAEYRYE